MDCFRRDVLDIIHFKLVRYFTGSLHSHQGSPEVIWQITERFFPRFYPGPVGYWFLRAIKNVWNIARRGNSAKSFLPTFHAFTLGCFHTWRASVKRTCKHLQRLMCRITKRGRIFSAIYWQQREPLVYPFLSSVHCRYTRWVTRYVAVATIGAIWILAAFVSFVPISLGLHRPNEPLIIEIRDGKEYPTCALDLTPTYAVVSSCISFYVPCIVLVAIYCR